MLIADIDKLEKKKLVSCLKRKISTNPLKIDTHLIYYHEICQAFYETVYLLNKYNVIPHYLM